MCGFAGIYLNDNSKLKTTRYEEVLNKMSKLIKSRGPDDKGIFIDRHNKLGLTFRRLSILDLNTTANQPMISRDKNWIIVFNGEVYNFKNLKSEINNNNQYWKTNSDTEVILELIAKYGFIKAIPKLNGMFAIAAFCISKKVLWLARDKFGEKPLYYNFSSTEGLSFTSDIRTFYMLPSFQKELNPEASAQYIRYGYVPDPLCILKNTYKLEAGSIIKYDKINYIKKIKYWDSFNEYIKASNKKFKGSFNDASDELKHKLDLSTKNRLISDVPVGVFLSGGIDSSNLVLSLSKQNIKAKTFSIGFYEKERNELAYANEISKELKTIHHKKFISEEECIKEINNIVTAYDEPFSDPSQIPTFILCKYVKNKIKVALSGEGADELFGGYPRYKNIKKYWNKIENYPYILRNNLDALSIKLGESNNSQLRSIGKKLRKKSHSSLDSIYRDEMSRWRPDENLYNQNLLKNSFFDIEYFSKYSEISDLRYLMLKDILTYLPSNLLVKVDRASMANSLEVRSPFLDNDLVSFSWSLPDHYIYNKNNGKALLKSILSERFSKNLVYRKKQGFEPPLDKWLKGPLKEWVRDLIFSDDNFLNKEVCINILDRFYKGEKNLNYKLWTIIMFKAWTGLYMSN